MDARFFLGSLACAWMIGISLRFLVDGFGNSMVFGVNHFDAFFDWSMLFALGFVLFIILIVGYIVESKKRYEK